MLIRGTVASLFALGILTVAGCADPNGGRQGLSGSVTFEGKPLNHGSIVFISDDPKAPNQASAAITNGAYEIPPAQGLVPGKYRVSITSPDGKTPDNDPNALPGPSGNFASKDRIPAKFNINSTLEAEVKKGEPNKFDFSIP